MALIKKAVSNGVIKGVSVCRGGPILSHLFFANDSIIFCKAFIENCDSLQRVLNVYELASSQQLNRAKTSLFFNSNTAHEVQEEIKSRFSAQVIKQHEKYLGLPLLVGKTRKILLRRLRTNWLGNWQDGKKSSCLRRGKKFWSRSWPKQYLHTP